MLADPRCGGFAAFEGWVRDHNEGQSVSRLEYEAFELLAVKEGERILAEARERFGVELAACVHRTGSLGIGDLAVWVGVSAPHRDEAFRACRYIIDEVKHRVPIWKKEHYVDGDSGWVNCERCAAPPAHVDSSAHAHAHDHEHHHSHAPPRPDYSRQTALREVGAAGQARLAAASVLVVGAGGLGVPVLQYLAGAGVGRLGIVDADTLEPSNLHRQTWYALAECGRPKAELAAERVRALNSDVRAEPRVTALDRRNGAELVADYDVVVDCTDRFATKFLLNDLCQQLGKTAVLSSVYQFEGQLQVVRPDRASPCLRCIWPETTPDGLVGNCVEAGVLGPVPGVFGTLQALETLKILLDLPQQLGDDVLVIDLLQLSTSRLRARRHPDCSNGCPRAAAALAACSQLDASLDDLELSFPTLGAAIDAGFSIVDIREPNEARIAPLNDSRARHVPMAQLLVGTNLPVEGRYLLVCSRGMRSLSTARELRARGVRSVHSLRGGAAALTT